MDDELSVLAVDFGVDDRVLGNLVEVERVIRSILEPPFDGAVDRVEREHARRPFVIARPILRIPVGAGIADALIDGVGLRIVGGGFPYRRAAVLPTLLAVLPGVVTGLACARDGVGPPRLLAGIEIGGVDESADAEFTAGGTDNRQVAHHQRRHGDGLAERRIGDLALPDLLAGRLVDGEHPAVQRDRDHLVLPQRDAAIVYAAAGNVAGPGAVDARVELPFDRALGAARNVDGVDAAPAVGDIHHAVLDDRRALEVAEGVAAAALQTAERDGEDELEVFDRIAIDLG